MDTASDRLTRTLELDPANFRRLYGVTKDVFLLMTETFQKRSKLKSGRPSPLSAASQVLCALQFWRDYPTFVRLGFDWGIDESTAQRTVERVENELIQSSLFQLPGKKILEENPPPSVVVDVTETPIEKPKKNKKIIIATRKNGTRSKRNSSSR
jgi:hypothetical protein